MAHHERSVLTKEAEESKASLSRLLSSASRNPLDAALAKLTIASLEESVYRIPWPQGISELPTVLPGAPDISDEELRDLGYGLEDWLEVRTVLRPNLSILMSYLTQAEAKARGLIFKGKLEEVFELVKTLMVVVPHQKCLACGDPVPQSGPVGRPSLYCPADACKRRRDSTRKKLARAAA